MVRILEISMFIAIFAVFSSRPPFFYYLYSFIERTHLSIILLVVAIEQYSKNITVLE